MARIDVLPSIDIIRGLKGILDFYVWKGLPCVRAWPRYRPARQTDASLAAALLFGAIVKAYATMGEIALQAYRDDAKNQPRSARDIYVSSQYGNLHEASMSDFLDALIIIRDAVVALTDLLHALDSIDTDEIVVNVDQSVLPPLAATTTNQTTQITALQKLDDLQDALASKALDRLLVRGMDQLYSVKSPLACVASGDPLGDNGYLDGCVVPAAQIWKVTVVCGVNSTRATTSHRLEWIHDGASYGLGEDLIARATGQFSHFPIELWMDPGDWIRFYYIGSLDADSVAFYLAGHRMTLET